MTTPDGGKQKVPKLSNNLLNFVNPAYKAETTYVKDESKEELDSSDVQDGNNSKCFD
eukprot:m.20873 g.20873  ORF g.20873 m.20873 type:complete len:57 (+) comp6983_c0_seq1:254-424(+)